MTDDQRERRGPWLGCLAVGMLIGLPLYALSIGPAKWLWVHGYLPPETNYLYYPVGVLANHCPPFETALHWYCELWGVPI